LLVDDILSVFKEQHILIDELVPHLYFFSKNIAYQFQTAELMHHRSFKEQKTSVVCQTPESLAPLLTIFERNEPYPIVVYGRSGGGKTTLMACAINEIATAHPNSVIIYRFLFYLLTPLIYFPCASSISHTYFRFIGTSMNSSDLYSVLQSVCQQIKLVYRLDNVTIPATLKELVKTFESLLQDESEARIGRPLYVILDSLDQFIGNNGFFFSLYTISFIGNNFSPYYIKQEIMICGGFQLFLALVLSLRSLSFQI
jgi:Cdc6-like AAA superfamily ATPase